MQSAQNLMSSFEFIAALTSVFRVVPTDHAAGLGAGSETISRR